MNVETFLPPAGRCQRYSDLVGPVLDESSDEIG
jgi:hypothetical protein